MLGVLTLYHAERDAFTKDHLRILLAISSKIGMSIENALRFRQAESSATTDYLTGLPNARSLFLQLDSELSRGRRTAAAAGGAGARSGRVQAGERPLRAPGRQQGAAARWRRGLKIGCREYDYVARMGGDEFVRAAAGPRPGEIAAKLQQMRDVIAQAGREVYIGGTLTVSIGAAHYPDDGDDADKLLSEADRRM